MANEYDALYHVRWKESHHFQVAILRPLSCNTCRHSMSPDAENHLTFERALQLRNSRCSSPFFSGVAVGRPLRWREHDVAWLYRLATCCAGRRRAVGKAGGLWAELHTSLGRLGLVGQQFRDLRVFFGLAGLDGRQRPPLVSRHGQGNSQRSTVESHVTTPPANTTSLRSSNMAGLPTSPIPMLSQAQPRVSLPAISVCTTSYVPPSGLDSPTTVLQIQSLTSDRCSPGKTEAFTKVSRAYTKALLSTPRPHQTDPQQYLLAKWKGPQQSGLKSSKEYTLRRSREPPATGEVFVDSSPSWGIGFMMNGRWLAWKLKDGWRSGGKENHWAEMVAVELGLRVAIASGSHAAPIMIRCDNVGVVQSLTTGKERDSERMDILRNIQQLCVRYNVQVTPRWIPTKDNPADGPSRGVFPARVLLVSNPPPLPGHLRGFLEDPVGFSLLPQS